MTVEDKKRLQQIVNELDARLTTLEAQIDVLKAKQRTQGPPVVIFKGKKEAEGLHE